MSDDKPTHGGARPGSGRKPGVGPFKGGRPVSTRKIRRGEPVFVWTQTAAGDPVGLGEEWIAVEMDRTKIVFRSEQTGDQITMRV